MKYFDRIQTLEDVKRIYRMWAVKLHPDNGGNEAAFKDMQNEYFVVFEDVKNCHRSADGTTYTKATSEKAERYADIINKIIFFDDVKIEIIGSWIWLTGNTYPYKDQIKTAGFFYSKSKKAWYYNGDTERSRRRGRYKLDDIRSKYGTEEVPNKKATFIGGKNNGNGN